MKKDFRLYLLSPPVFEPQVLPLPPILSQPEPGLCFFSSLRKQPMPLSQ
jgi:hypothetical protein